MEYKDVNILVVDDDRVDVLAVTDALTERKIGNKIYVASDGVQALAMLRGEEGVEHVEWPVITLLDLRMPRMNGVEFLKEVRSDPVLQRSIIFVLTTSEDDRDIIAAYDHHVAGYLVKSAVGQDFMGLLALLEDFKLVVQFPLRA